MDNGYAKKLAADTAKVYDSIAGDFSRTRSWRSPEMEKLIVSHINPGTEILDIGCGNGRFCRPVIAAGANYTGVDSSKELIGIARLGCPGVKFEIGDATDLPFPAEAFDLAFSVAVLHHIPSKELRVRFFYEACRVLKAGGIFLATAWDLRPWHLVRTGEWRRLRHFAKEQFKIAARLSKSDFGDFYVPWQNKYQRYVHVCTLREMRSLAELNGFKIEKSGILKANGSKEQNLYIVAKKCEKENGV